MAALCPAASSKRIPKAASDSVEVHTADEVGQAATEYVPAALEAPPIVYAIARLYLRGFGRIGALARRKCLWDVQQYAGYGQPVITNSAYHDLCTKRAGDTRKVATASSPDVSGIHK